MDGTTPRRVAIAATTLCLLAISWLPVQAQSPAAPDKSTAADSGFVIHRGGWSFDRSSIEWCPWAKPDKEKAAGTLNSVAGWADYDIEIPKNGWYELSAQCVWGWNRDIFIDGKLLFYLTRAAKEDLTKRGREEWAKEANIWLEKGKHTLRYRRNVFPPCLPTAWELTAANGRPEACLRASSQVYNVQPAGTSIEFTVLGGRPEGPTTYQLVLRDLAGDETKLEEVGQISFPAIQKPVEKKISVRFPREGQFRLLAQCDDKIFRPNDLKAGDFCVIDTKSAPPPPADLKTTPVIDINCVKNTINGQAVKPGENYFENRCKTEVVNKGGLNYRELIPTGEKGKDAETQRQYETWACESFAYKFDLPEEQALYRLRVDYPDDDRRTMGFHLQDFPKKKGGWIQGGGVETGDHYPLSRSMLTHESYFHCREPKGLVMPVVNLLPGWKAAAARIRIDKVVDGLPAAPDGCVAGRASGFYFEEPGRWHSYFGGEPGEAFAAQLKPMERWAQWNRYVGANLMNSCAMVYNGVTWPSRAAEGWGTNVDVYTPRMLALIADKYGQKFIPEVHVSGSRYFERDQFGLGFDEKAKKLEILWPGADEVVIRDLNGNATASWRAYVYNALHPKVQDKYVDLIGELADQCGDTESFAGVGCRLMLGWQWAGFNALPGLKFGYDDWTVAAFERDSGIKVPGAKDSQDRFHQRFDFLTGQAKAAWMKWRCDKIFALHKRVLARIRQAKPDAKLFLPYFGPSDREAIATDMLGQMREVGIDPDQYAQEPNIVILQGGMYGRRFSTPLSDAECLDPALYSPEAAEVARWGGRGRCVYTSYFEYAKTAEFPKIGGAEDNFINDCCVPSGVNEREMFAIALADGDAATVVNGGAGWMFGTPSVMQPLLREFKSLPPIQFEQWDKARDPVAVWSRRHDGRLWFYAVNRLPVPVEAELRLTGRPKAVNHAVDDTPADLDFKLEPFMLKAFHATGDNVALGSIKLDIPSEFVAKAKRTAEFSAWLRDGLRSRRICPEIPKQELDAVLSFLDAAVEGFPKGEYWKAWRVDQLPLVKIYALTGRFPPGMWERGVPCGLVDKTGSVKTGDKQIFGDVRGHLDSCLSLGACPDGGFWAFSDKQAMRFGPDGKYVESRHLFTPFGRFTGDARHYSLPVPSLLGLSNAAVLADGRIAARAWPTPLYIYDPATGRSIKDEAGGGIPMEHPALPLANLPDGSLLVAWNDKNRGVRAFKPDGSEDCRFPGEPPTNRLCAEGANGGAADAAGNIYLAPLTGGLKVLSPNGKELESIPSAGKLGSMATAPDGSAVYAAKGSHLVAFKRGADGKLSQAWDSDHQADISAIAMLKDGSMAVGFKKPCPDGAIIKLIRPEADKAEQTAAPVMSLAKLDGLRLDGHTQLKSLDGEIHFTASGKLWRLKPGDAKASMAYDPKFPGHLAPFEAFAFAPNGDLYLASHWVGSGRGANLYRAKKTDGGLAPPEYLNDRKPLYASPYVIITDLAVDKDGKVILRLKDPELPTELSLFRWSPDTGKSDRLLSLRTPINEHDRYGLHILPDGGLLVAGGSTRSIWRLAPDGKIVWSKSCPKNYIPGSFDCREPMGVTMDSKGRVWVADRARNQIMCLDGDGNYLESFGQFGGLDDRGGLGLCLPVGLAAVKDPAGNEWLHVADIGNQRIVKWLLR